MIFQASTLEILHLDVTFAKLGPALTRPEEASIYELFPDSDGVQVVAELQRAVNMGNLQDPDAGAALPIQVDFEDLKIWQCTARHVRFEYDIVLDTWVGCLFVDVPQAEAVRDVESPRVRACSSRSSRGGHRSRSSSRRSSRSSRSSNRRHGRGVKRPSHESQGSILELRETSIAL